MNKNSTRLLAQVREKIENRGQQYYREKTTMRPKRIELPNPFAYADEGKKSFQLEDFLRFYDIQFLNFAYRKILKRDPDVDGMESRLESLRVHKISRIEIIGRLKYGSEGRKKDIVIRGLLPAFILARTSRVRVLGFFIRTVIGLRRIATVQTDLEHMRGLIEAARQESYAMDALLSSNQNTITEWLEKEYEPPRPSPDEHR